MELLLIIAAIWLYNVYRKADDATKKRYKAKLMQTYDRVLSETQKNSSDNRTSAWKSSERERPIQRSLELDNVTDYHRPRPDQPINPDGPTIQRTRRFFGPNYED